MRVLVVLAACGACDGAAPPAPPPPPPPPPPVVHALPSEAIAAWNHDGSWHVVLGKGVTCEYRWQPADAIVLDLAVSVAPDGTRTWALRTTVPEVDSKVTVGAVDQTTLTLPLTLAYGTPRSRRAGSVTAKVCTTRDDGPRGDEVPSTATMTIANMRFPIAGAIRRGDTLELSDVPRSCSPTWLTRATLVRRDGRWTLAGGLFAPHHTGDGAGLHADVGKARKLALSGATSLDGYSVILAGAIDVLDCAPANKVRPQVVIGPDPIGRRLGLERVRAVGHADGDDDDELIGCERDRCWARMRDGKTLTCVASGLTADYIARGAHGYVEFDREPGDDACTGFTTMSDPQ